MKDNQAKYPQLRFKGFTDPWEQRKIGNYFTERSERSSNGELISVTINSGVVKASTLDRKDNSSKNKYNYKKVEIGDIAYNSMRMWQGASGYSPYSGILSPAYTVITSKDDVDSKFFAYQFKKHDMIQIFQRNSQGLTSDTWNLKFPSLKSIKVAAPAFDEQKRIATFLEEFDHLITLHQRKLAKLKELKQGYLQKLFPKNGSKFPQLRFAGFADAWEQRKLGELGSTFTGLTGKTKEDFGHGDAKFVTYMNVFQNAVASLEQLDSVEIDPKQNEVKKGDVFFTTSSETPEEVGMSSVWKYNYDNVYLNSFTFGYRPNIDFDLDYLAAMLRSTTVRKKITFLAQGISRYNISKTKMMDIEVPVPSLEEQAKIGAFLSNVEQTITLHQRKLDLLKEQKKGFLQKMFV
ncbi:restriction endonuclease subunit S [Lactiplantibacillus pentosus]|uniref:restriction endonuclease subunit S n=1 Tax=Lactiplantibacillus pentosus TaxID=1589 RepID=UPI0021A369E8|nr:restriction endonuclease subunit S [Lactiplantibacillus pentosus]MCT3330619.1 restriction endonuclease subunit S [Lactiplantibacillus pentosus]